MIRLSHGLIVLAGAAALAGMMLTQPDYGRATRPFVSHAGAGDWAETRLFRARLDGWRSADRVALADGRALDSAGVFLIVDMTIAGQGVSTTADALWIGASGRRYAATRRVADLPRQVMGQWFQPGLDSRATALFELPPDEIAGGALMLTRYPEAPLDGTLRLDALPGMPAHRAIESLGP